MAHFPIYFHRSNILIIEVVRTKDSIYLTNNPFDSTVTFAFQMAVKKAAGGLIHLFGGTYVD